ncbi:unnamed protein product [Ectocarpus sp. 8 AP-2014]
MMCYWFSLDGAPRVSSHASRCTSLSAHCIPPPASLLTLQRNLPHFILVRKEHSRCVRVGGKHGTNRSTRSTTLKNVLPYCSCR